MDNIKLTPYQLTFYYEWLNNPSRSDYNMITDNTLEGKVDLNLFEDTFKKIFSEHFITCHTVSNQADGIFWVPQKSSSKTVNYYDKPLTDKQITELVSAPFNLEQDLQPRAHLIDLGDDKYRMIIIFHHIIIDGISNEEIWEKIRKNYNGIHYQVPSIEVQKQMHQALYESFETLLTQQKEQMNCFWSEHLKDVKNIDLSFLKRSQKPSNEHSIPLPSEYLFSFDNQIETQVKTLRRKYKMTTYMFGQLVMALLLHKIVRQSEIPLVYPVAISEGKELIYGAHVNTLLINYHFDEQTTLQSIMEGMISYHKNLKKCNGKYLPIYEIMSYADNPSILDVAFIQTFFRDHQSSFQGVTKDYINHDFQIDLSNKLVFEQEAHNNCINYRVKFNQQQLDKTLVQQFATLYQKLFIHTLNLLTNDQADILTKDIELLSQTDYSALILDNNQATRRPYAKDKTVTQLFEERVLQSPQNTAVIFNQTCLSYELLNKKSNQLAHYLKENCGIRPNDFVGLYLDRSEDIVTSILAILKSGAAYVPMDPEAPNERNSFIMQDAQLKAVITQQHYQTRLASLAPNLAIFSIDQTEFIQAVEQYPTENPVTDTTPHDLAYAIYTSGTTGNPKGTLIEHHNINRLVVNANFVNITHTDRLLSVSGYQFDASTYDIFGALLNGAGVVIATKDNFLNLDLFNQLINDYKVTNFFATAAFFNTLVDAELPNLAQLKYILAGGEALSAVHVNKFLALYPHVKLINGYGPTETTTFAVTYLTNQAKAPFDHSVPIGVALTNTALYVLDEQLRPVPMGAIGELYIGGAGVGRGYLNNPELTAKVFINNPFQTAEEKAEGYNNRIYKTGDLVRLLPDGNIEYFGRNDFQVKIRGFRIELSEIEARLVSHPEIKQAIVLALDNNTANKYLAAYYVSENEIPLEALSTYLQQYLPDYMMPTAFIHLTELPVNMNGKVDRRALPSPSLTAQDEYVAPSTPTEQRLAEIYSEFLGIAAENISVTNDFFKLGGNSILAIKLAGKVARTFDKAVSVADIFTHRTLQALAGFIEQSEAERIHITPSIINDPEQQLLSFAQERLWFIDSYEGGSSAYNIPLIFKIKDSADLTIIQQAIESIVSRHEILHTLIKTNKEGLGYQQVIDLQSMPLVFNHMTCENREHLDTSLYQHAYYIFKLNQEYPISINDYTLNNERYLSVIIHHIAFDGWSIDLFIKELAYYYSYFSALKNGDTQHAKLAEIEPVEIQYKDFALWQRQYLQGKVLDQQLQYWQQQLVDYEPLNLPTDHLRPLQIDYTGRDINFNLGSTLSQQLRTLAADLNVSLYSVLLSGYYLLLSAFSNQKDIVIGTPIAGRHYQAIENTMGFFVNSLALRQQIKSEQHLKDFIQQTGQLINEAQQYQDLPFEKLVDAIQIEKDASRHPIFQVMFGVQSFGSGKLQDIEQLLELYQLEHSLHQPAKFDITTLLDDSKEAISGQFNYATSLFDEQTIQHYITVYQYILEQFATLCHQQQPIAKLQYLNKNLYQTLVYDSNQTQQPFAKDKVVATLFAEQVAKTPHHTAIIFNQTHLSYEELNKQANQLAHFLQAECHVQPNDFIGLYLDRSEQIIVSILAVLKAGAAYVPMDPDAPNERNGFIMQDAKLKAVITQAHYQNRLIELAPSLAVYCIDQADFKQTVVNYSIENPTAKTKPTDLAYSIYTSGTTGNPKGTLIKQYNINRLIINTNYVDITESDHLLSISGYQFDASTYDIFGSLLNGASVVIATKDNFLNLEQFNQLISDYKITNFFATTAFFNTLVDAELPNLAQLRYVLFGGEAVSAIHVNKFRKCYPTVNLVHVYGPTESTTYATYYLTNQVDKPFGHTVPIGKPLSNTTTYVLNEQLYPVPIGAIGELYIGGAGVGLGYLNNPEMTHKVFIKNPFQTDQEKTQQYNDTLYKTGDLVRYLADGNIEYVSRNDFQVKIRGFRIELGEIEARLISHPAIKQAVVLALTNNAGAKYLVAYYVANEALSPDTLSQYLQAYLPEYMIPAVFMYLEALPMNINGKVNHRVLPKPSFTNSNTAYVAPTNETEAVFCKTFADVLRLQVDSIGIEDDFFKLGGDSISSIQLANRIRQALNYYLSIKDIFNHRTVKKLSDYVIKHQHSLAPVIQSEQGVLEGEIPLAPIQQWFFQNIERGKLPDYEHWNQSFLIQVPPLNVALLKLSITKLVAYHDILRATYQTASVGYYQPMTDEIAFTPINVKGLSEKQIAEQLTQWQSHFSFTKGALYHIGYLEGYADHTARIHVAAHHLNIDAVSWRIIKNDLQTLYQFLLAQGERLDPSISPEKILGDKGTSYRQWINNQQKYPASTVRGYASEQTYWHEIIADLDDYNKHLDSYRIDTLNKTNISLSKEYTHLLLREVHNTYNTDINDVLITALANALKLFLKRNQNYILLEGHGREDLFPDMDVNNTVGWFTCMYPVKLCTTDKQEIVESIPVIKDTLRAIPNHGLGYGILFGYTKQTLPAICFNYLGQFDSDTQNQQWSFSNESSGLAVSANNRNTDFLSLNGGVLKGQLQFNVEGYVNATQLEYFSAIFTQQLEQLIDRVITLDRHYLTASDINYTISNELLNSLQANNEIEAIYPANSLQQGFIYHAVSQGESDTAYRIQIIWDYHNSLQPELLKQAWQLTQAKHPILRVRFSWAEELIQIIDKQSGFDWAFIDLSEQTLKEQQQATEAVIEKDRQISYDLAQGRLFRVYLVKFAKDHYRCIFNNHHAILDGWSLPLLLNDIHQHYIALVNNQPLTIQADKSYLNAQAFLQSQTDKTQDFWQNYLIPSDSQENLEGLLKPEMRHINLSEHKYVKEPQELEIIIDAKQCEQLKTLCQTHEFTLNALMQYCWHQQLSLYSNTHTTTIGMTVSGRNLPIDGIETSIGLYINTLPVMLEHKDETVVNTVKQLQEHINNVNNHSDINLIKLQTSGERLFNSLFVFENYPISDKKDEQLQITFKEGKEKLDYPLGIVVFEKAGNVSFKIKYAGELFNQASIERLLQGISLTLTQLINNPNIRAKELQLLTASEYTQLITAQLENTVPFIQTKLISQLFEDQVNRTPNNIALVYEDKQFTYQALNVYTNQLAHFLTSQFTLRADSLVGLYLDKSEHMVISILAVLKAGAAYVPMSPQAPADRIQFMLADTQAEIILTHQCYYDSLKDLAKDAMTEVIAVDNPSLIDELNLQNSQNIKTKTQANHLAYVIYTSGTTGQPKGVMIEHHTLANLATAQQDILELTTSHHQDDQKNVLWYSSYVFDAHAFEIYNALLNGHCLHVLAEHKRLDFMALHTYIKDQAIDFAFIPPALLDNNDLLPVPVLTVGGEAANAELVTQYCEQGVKLINVYGPSETTVWATAHTYQKDDLNTNIGQSIHNVCTYILDQYLRPVPVGVIGELYIGGAGVGRGYLNNPEMTASVFINNPLQTAQQKTQKANQQLYKTGDLARYLSNGDIEYIGRNDFQVKIRGFRIELGEIETRLISHTAIKQVIVLALDNTAGNKYLVAYYVADSAMTQEELTDYLQQFLPDYMIPTAFVQLETIPLTINGKVDRHALPEPTLTWQEQYVAPTTDTERQVIELTSEFLGIAAENISVVDDFFKLGGNSILAIKLASKMTKVFAKPIHITDLFTYRTAKALAIFIDNSQAENIAITAPVVTNPEQQLLSFAQERLWFIDCYEGGSNAYNIPLVIKVNNAIDLTLIEKAIQAIVSRHEILRTLIKTNQEGFGYQQIIDLKHKPLVINPIACESQEALNAFIDKHIHRVFALSQEYPISINHYQLARESYMSIVVHHIAFDGWSIDLFIKELTHYYAYFSALKNGHTEQAKELAPIAIQYKDFALWQRQFLQGKVLEQQLQYWQQQLEGYEPLNLPTDYVRPLQIDYTGQDINFQLDKALSQQLRALAAELNVSLYSVLLSGYYLLLSAFSNQQDIVIGTPIAGRHYPAIENTIGFFVNTLALRQQIEPKESLKDFIQHTGKLVHEAQKHQDLPFEKLVDALQVEKDASRHPIFQVMFGVQSFGGDAAQNGEQLFATYHSEQAHYQTAKFDITTLLDDSQASITGVFNFATHLFDKTTIQRYIKVYQSILEQFAVLCQKQQPITQLQYLDKDSYQEIITQWNQTQRDFPQEATVHGLFETQVLKTPHNIAMRYEDDRLTYQELNKNANQLAHYLRDQLAIKPDELVALCLDRSKYMLISILATLKAGGAYVPMDPQAPEDRISYMINNAEAKVILTTNSSYEKVKALASTTQTVINLQAEATLHTIANYSDDNPTPLAKPNNLAYVIYTSGTTGNPKGVMLEHYGVINRIVWMHEQYPITEQDHILQKTNYTFDVSVWELFWANWYGACIVFAHPELYKDNVYLANLIYDEQITVLHFVPSMLLAFVETLDSQPELQRKVQGLRYLFCSGEALNAYEVRKCHRLMPNCEVHNLYGPTEATVDVLYYDCNIPHIKDVPIGKPIANTSAYILNNFLQPVPIGGIGELHVGGVGVARGYLNNLSLTNEKFITNPFQTEQEKQPYANGRIYKTGDLVRALPDGNIQYLGRNDFQIKIRGFRIELGEIEVRLTQYPQINHAVVLAYEHSSGNKYLVAYYVSSQEIEAQLLQEHLHKTLPSYMVPSAFIHLSELPITSNGKLNRRALPRPELTNTVAYVAPETPIEITLCEIFAKILNISASEISMEDNFFKLSGNSILAMVLNNRINEALNIKLRLVDILTPRTIRELSIKITDTKEQFNPIVVLNNAVHKPQMFMIHPGIGGCDVYSSLANQLREHYYCYGVDSYNLYHEEKIDNLYTLSQYYLENINTVLNKDQPITLLGWSLGGQIALEIAANLEAIGIKNITVYLLDTWLLHKDDLISDSPLIDLTHAMRELNIPPHLQNKLENIAEVDNKLVIQPLSAPLTETNIILFKAIDVIDTKRSKSLYQKYPLNNIDAYITSPAQLQLVEINVNHYKILEKEQEIISYIADPVI